MYEYTRGGNRHSASYIQKAIPGRHCPRIPVVYVHTHTHTHKHTPAQGCNGQTKLIHQHKAIPGRQSLYTHSRLYRAAKAYTPTQGYTRQTKLIHPHKAIPGSQSLYTHTRLYRADKAYIHTQAIPGRRSPRTRAGACGRRSTSSS